MVRDMIRTQDIVGGSRYLSITGNLSLRKHSPAVINLASSGAFDVVLPTDGVLPGKKHHIVNGSTFAVSLFSGTAPMFSLPAGQVAVVWAVVPCDGAGVEWKGLARAKNPTSPRHLKTSATVNPCNNPVVTIPDGGGTDACPGLTDALDQLVIDYPNTLIGLKVGSCCLGAQFNIDTWPAKGSSASFTYNSTSFVYTVVSDPGAATSGDVTLPGDGFPCADGTSVLLIVEPA